MTRDTIDAGQANRPVGPLYRRIDCDIVGSEPTFRTVGCCQPLVGTMICTGSSGEQSRVAGLPVDA